MLTDRMYAAYQETTSACLSSKGRRNSADLENLKPLELPLPKVKLEAVVVVTGAKPELVVAAPATTTPLALPEVPELAVFVAAKAALKPKPVLAVLTAGTLKADVAASAPKPPKAGADVAAGARKPSNVGLGAAEVAAGALKTAGAGAESVLQEKPQTEL